jgi:hypothetical protein
MTKQQKIMIGIIGVGAIAYYLWRKNRPKSVLVSSRPSQPSDFESKAELKKINTGDSSNLGKPQVGKYVVTMQTNLLRRNPNKKDMYGDEGTDVVRTLRVGEVLDIVKLGGGGRGVVMTPYYFLADGTFVSGNVVKKA